MRFLKANKIFNGKIFLPDNSVLVLNGQNNLIEILPESKVSNQIVEYFEGIITPGFVNAHCHLELSYLANKIPVKTGLVNFIINIIKQRQLEYKKEQIIESAFNADLEMWQNGIVVVGDISNNEDSFKIKQNSKIKYHTFVEVIGLNPNNKSKTFDNALLLYNQLRELKLKDEEVRTIIQASLDKGREMVRTNSKKLDAIAKSLLSQETITAVELKQIMDSVPSDPPEKVSVKSKKPNTLKPALSA